MSDKNVVTQLKEKKLADEKKLSDEKKSAKPKPAHNEKKPQEPNQPLKVGGVEVTATRTPQG